MCDVANPNVLANIKFYMDKVGGFLEEALAYCWKTISKHPNSSKIEA
jgi:hypothetical protein